MKINFRSPTFWGLILFASLIFAIFFLPLLTLEIQQTVNRFIYTLIFLSAFLSLEKRYNWLLVISLVALLMEWIAGFFKLPLLSNASKTINVLFFITIVVLLIRQIAASKDVDLKVILGAVMGYLLLGLMYSIFIAVIIQADPSAFNIPHDDISPGNVHLSESIYFTFVSMATLGYGDLLPLKPYSRSFAIFITVSGQLYLGIIIALLVGKFSAAKS